MMTKRAPSYHAARPLSPAMIVVTQAAPAVHKAPTANLEKIIASV